MKRGQRGLTGSQGSQGVQGAQGIPGPQGIQGQVSAVAECPSPCREISDLHTAVFGMEGKGGMYAYLQSIHEMVKLQNGRVVKLEMNQENLATKSDLGSLREKVAWAFGIVVGVLGLVEVLQRVK